MSWVAYTIDPRDATVRYVCEPRLHVWSIYIVLWTTDVADAARFGSAPAAWGAFEHARVAAIRQHVRRLAPVELVLAELARVD